MEVSFWIVDDYPCFFDEKEKMPGDHIASQFGPLQAHMSHEYSELEKYERSRIKLVRRVPERRPRIVEFGLSIWKRSCSRASHENREKCFNRPLLDAHTSCETIEYG
jgi:hypothetical protein